MNRVVIEETMRRCMTIAFGAYLGLLAIIAFGTSAFDRPGSVWPSLVALLAFIIGCTPIGPEFSAGTLQLILTKPVNRSTYLLSRVTGIVLVVWGAAIVACACEIIGRAIWAHTMRIEFVIAALVNSFADTVLICALLVLLGSLTRAYFNVAIYFVLMIGLNVSQGIIAMMRGSRGAMGDWLRNNNLPDRVIAFIDQNLFPDRPPVLDRDWLLLVLSNAAIALVLACFAFRNREVPYGAD